MKLDFAQARVCTPQWGQYQFVQTPELLEREIKKSAWAAPYSYVCSKESINKDRADQNKEKYLNALKARVFEKLNLKIEHYEKLVVCLSKNVNCDAGDTINHLLTLTRTARNDLLLSSTRESDPARSRVPNRDVNLGPVYKSKTWQAFSSEEIGFGFSELYQLSIQAKEIISEANPSLKENSTEFKDIVSQSIHLFRLQKYDSYVRLLVNEPILQILQTANPSKNDFLNAAKIILDKLKTEKKWLEENIKKTDGVCALISYESFVETLLKEEPSYCSAATGLAWTCSNKKYWIKTASDILDVGLITASSTAPYFNIKWIAWAVPLTGKSIIDSIQYQREATTDFNRSLLKGSKNLLEKAKKSEEAATDELIGIPTSAILAWQSDRIFRTLKSAVLTASKLRTPPPNPNSTDKKK